MTPMSVALRVEGVSKRYRIYNHPVDLAKEYLTLGLWKTHREFWALSDLSFEIEAGTTTGIIGPNGCGKSTLLQIITGTLDPTEGNVWHEGRIAALLELGAGFNMEFTGIENVYMNAALMGFSRAETDRLLPEIERFAEIGPFIQQPVKTYSSGMYVRLAFAVAISANPEILIIDEALAVGDAVFQHRCVRRIREMQENGATILFVSHDTSAVRALCSRAILLNAGRIEIDGTPNDALYRYQELIMSREAKYEAERPADAAKLGRAARSSLAGAEGAVHSYTYRHGDRSAEILSVELLDAVERPIRMAETGDHLLLRVRACFFEDAENPVVGFLIRNRFDVHLYGTNTELQQLFFGHVGAGEVIEVTFAFSCWLAPDVCSVTVAVHSSDGISFDWLDGALTFHVSGPPKIDGVANLNASVTARRLGPDAGDQVSAESISASPA
jgi:ABC-type polysaccharide/polyol phosphate transport system ATPase subunit